MKHRNHIELHRKKWNKSMDWAIFVLSILGVISLFMWYIIPFLFIHIVPLEGTKEFFFGKPDVGSNSPIKEFFFGKPDDGSGSPTNSDIIGTLGTVGDWFGGTTVPLLTFLSFVGIMFGLYIQRRQLSLQMEELKETREVFVIQRFENTFFNMINLHNDIVRNIKIDRIPHPQYPKSRTEDLSPSGSGRDSFEILYERLDYPKFVSSTESLDSILQKTIDCYEDFFKTYQPSIGHYFRNLYRIIKFIHEQKDLSLDAKKDYIGMLRAQLSTYELLLIFYNGISDYGSEKFLPLIKKYNLLDNMNKELLKRTPNNCSSHDDYFIYKNSFEESKLQLLVNKIYTSAKSQAQLVLLNPDTVARIKNTADLILNLNINRNNESDAIFKLVKAKSVVNALLGLKLNEIHEEIFEQIESYIDNLLELLIDTRETV